MKYPTYRGVSLAVASMALVLQAQPVLAQAKLAQANEAYPWPAQEAVNAPGGLSAGDRNFILRAAADEMFELEMSRLAAQKSSAPDLKAYASSLVEQHLGVQQELAALAQAKGLTLPNTMSAARQREIMRLQKLSGDDFDRQYFQAVGLRAHRQNIRLFTNASRGAQDPDVRAWASKMLPAQNQHLSDARALPSARRLNYMPADSNTPGGM